MSNSHTTQNGQKCLRRFGIFKEQTGKLAKVQVQTAVSLLASDLVWRTMSAGERT